MSQHLRAPGRGMTASMVRSGEPIEISDGVPIYCLPTLPRGAAAQNLGAAVIQSDPAVEYAATEVGFSPKPEMLRAPDVAVLPGPPKDGWLEEAPPLVIEYADRGQDWCDLKKKIREYLEHGVRYVWVVRLDGPHRVEVYVPGADKAVFGPGQDLLAPGVLSRPVRVEALYDPRAAHEAVLANILAKTGVSSLEEVFEEGRSSGREEGLTVGREEGLTVGREEGLVIGREEGLQAGLGLGREQARGEARLGLVAVYAARFGAPPLEVVEALDRRSIGELWALFPLFATHSMDDIRATLS